MNSEILSRAKNKLKNCLKDKRVIDVIIFGSALKGKAEPRDIDAALIIREHVDINIEGIHISQIKPEEFFINPPSLATTLLREGYSLKKNKSLAEVLRFDSKILFSYTLKNKNSSEKVKIVNFLRGKGKTPGIVEENGGEWIANQVFMLPLKSEHIIEKFLINSKVMFKKHYILIH
ncbi:MAG: hypothetical protein QXD13_02065 [Candidatus Pacearchaeota archaeon]